MIDKNDPRLTAYALGEVDDQVRAEVESAIASSPELQSVVSEITRKADLLKEVFASDLKQAESETSFVVTGGRSDSSESNSRTPVPALKKRSNWVVWSTACSIAVLAGSIAVILWMTQGNQDIAMQGEWTFHTPVESQDKDQALPSSTGKVDPSFEFPDADEWSRNSRKRSKFPNRPPAVMLPIEASETESSPEDGRGPALVYGGGLNLPKPSGSEPGDIGGGIGGGLTTDSWDASNESFSGDRREEASGEFLSGGEIPIEIARQPNAAELVRQLQEDQSLRGELLAKLRATEQFDGKDEIEIPVTGDFAVAPEKVNLNSITDKQLADLSKAIIPDAVDTFTFDESTTTQRATDSELLKDLLGDETRKFRLETRTRNVPVTKYRMETRTRNLPDGTVESYTVNVPYTEQVAQNYTVQVPYTENSKLTSGDQFRASFDVDRRIAQAEVQLETALQRFGPTHPQIKSLQGQLAAWKKFKERIGSPELTAAAELIPILLRRVNPNGTQEIDFKQLELNPDMLEEDYLETAGAKDVELTETLKAAIGYFESIASDEEKKSLKESFIAAINKELQRRVTIYNRRVRQRRGWKRVKAVSNTSRLIVGDKDELDLTGMQVQVQVDGFRARVLVDYFYYNDRDRQLEGNFKIRLPDDSSMYYFAFGQSAYDFSPDGPLAVGEFRKDGDQYVSLRPAEIGLARQDAWKNVKESRMVPREKAAFAYNQTVRRRVDPALVEWSGAGIFNARVFPLMPKQLHRIVIGYDVNLTATDSGYRYQLDLPQQMGECRVDLSVADFENGKWELVLDGQPEDKQSQPTRWEAGTGAGGVRSQKRLRFTDPEWSSLKLLAKTEKPIVLQSSKGEKGEYFATQFQANLPAEKQTANRRGVFVVDTSLSSRPEKFNVWLDLMKATLGNNRDDLEEFAVLFFDVDSRFWRSSWTNNTEENVSELMKDCFQIGLEGATNLHGAMLELSDAKWLLEDSQRPDLFLLSDGAANWGETDLRIIQNEYAALDLGSIFAYQTGMNGTAIANLRFLTSSTGGAVFSLPAEKEIANISTAHRNKPWKLLSVQSADTSDVMTAGRIEWVYPGQWVTVVGRGKLSEEIELQLQQGEQTRTVSVPAPTAMESEMAARLYGQVSVGQLESLGDATFDISAAYARHFRITGKTCSLLMLDSEADYKRFNIVPEQDGFVVDSKDASSVVAAALEKLDLELVDPKAKLLSWLKRLESMQGLEFKMPTALKVALDEVDVETIDCRLDCQQLDAANWSKKYSKALSTAKLDADVVEAEVAERLKISSDDAVRVQSSLVEANPGDWVIARDVAFAAMELDRPAVAYHLLRGVVQSRPFDGSCYAAIGQCLQQLGKSDMAIIFYELAIGSNFANQGPDFHKIVATHYQSLLHKIQRGELESKLKKYAEARLKLMHQFKVPEKSDLVISMMWNTDQTDVDLHVVEPSGEECYYQNRKTRSGGNITTDKTDGFGPEMYVLPSAAKGNYQISAKYFRANQNRTKVSNKVYLTIYRNYGTKDETVSREIVRLTKVGEKELVKELRWKD